MDICRHCQCGGKKGFLCGKNGNKYCCDECSSERSEIYYTLSEENGHPPNPKYFHSNFQVHIKVEIPEEWNDWTKEYESSREDYFIKPLLLVFCNESTYRGSTLELCSKFKKYYGSHVVRATVV